MLSNSPDKLDKYIRTIYNKAADMDRLIDELFLFSKLDLGKVPFQFETVDLGHYVQDCAQELQFDMEKKGVQFTLTDLPQEPLIVTADRDKLRRVLLNIIENAIKYSEEGKCQITLTSARNRRQFAVIQIKDNGQGISEEALPHIFDRFYRADPSRNTATGGSGLGLAIAKQIMEEHGGTHWRNECGWAGHHRVYGLTAYQREGKRSMSRILIVEDEQSIAELERDYLEINGYEVDIETSGDRGLERALTMDYDLVILDLMLPMVDGFEICRRIRSEKDIPIVMVSAKKEDIDKIRGLGLGADDYMIKPFSPSELVARVKAHLARYERLMGTARDEERRSSHSRFDD